MESKVEILKALKAMKQKVSVIVKEKVKGVAYAVVKYDTLVEDIRDIALEHDLHLLSDDCLHTNHTTYEAQQASGSVNMKYDTYIFKFKLWHGASGEFLNMAVPAVGLNAQDKGPSNAITFASKNAWEKILMLKRGDENDPDQKNESHYTNHRPTQQQQQRTQSDVRTQQAQQRPQQQAPVRQGGQLTSDPATWPAEWQNVLKIGTAKAKNEQEIHNDPDFKAMDLLRASKDAIDAKGCPKIISDAIMHQVAGWLINTVMKTGHAQVSCTSVLENWEEFEGYIGKGEKADKIKKILEDYTPW